MTVFRYNCKCGNEQWDSKNDARKRCWQCGAYLTVVTITNGEITHVGPSYSPDYVMCNRCMAHEPVGEDE